MLAAAVALLSGPAGHAAALRRKLAGGPAVPVSLPLDIPGVFDTIPVHLRRAVRNATGTAGSPAATSPSPPATSTTSSTAKTAAGTP